LTRARSGWPGARLTSTAGDKPDFSNVKSGSSSTAPKAPQGERHTVARDANRDQIEKPDLIEAVPSFRAGPRHSCASTP
jgi:hypothetical protein